MRVPIDERVDRWMALANADVAAAELLLDARAHLACFHAQQAAEKALKALLTRVSGEAVSVNVLARLIDEIDGCDEAVPPEVRATAEGLDKYYVPTRYPDALGFADATTAYKAHDAREAIAAAQRIIDWCAQRSNAYRAARA